MKTVLSVSVDNSFEYTSLFTLVTSVSAANAIRRFQCSSAGLDTDSDILEEVWLEMFLHYLNMNGCSPVSLALI